MNNLQRISALLQHGAEARCRRIFGWSILTMSLLVVSGVAAQPQPDRKPQRGPHAPSAPGPAGRNPAGLFGGPQGASKPHPGMPGPGAAGPAMHGFPHGMAGMPGFGHGHGFAGEPSFGSHRAGAPGHWGTWPSPAQRKARFEELKKKEAEGKLTPQEKAELERAERAQAFHVALKKRAVEMAESRKNRAREARRQAMKEFPQLSQDAAAVAEYKKHAERLAKLERARELAAADQNDEMVSRVDALIAKEKQRHQTWLTNHQNAAPSAASGAHS